MKAHASRIPPSIPNVRSPSPRGCRRERSILGRALWRLAFSGIFAAAAASWTACAPSSQRHIPNEEDRGGMGSEADTRDAPKPADARNAKRLDVPGGATAEPLPEGGRGHGLFNSDNLVPPAALSCDAVPFTTFSGRPGFHLGDAYLASHFMLYDLDERWNEDAIAAQLDRIGLGEVEFFPRDLVLGNALKGFVAAGQDLVVVHIKGTTGHMGWVQNALFATWPAGDLFPESGWQHVGFRDFYRALKDKWDLEGRLERLVAGGRRLLFTGHSQGAALTLLAAARARQRGLDVIGVYTTGQPRVGDAKFTARLEKILEGRWHRLRFEDDFVSHLAPVSDAAWAFKAASAKVAPLAAPFAIFAPVARYVHGAGLRLASDGTIEAETSADDARADLAFWSALGAQGNLHPTLGVEKIAGDHYPEKYHCALGRALERSLSAAQKSVTP